MLITKKKDNTEFIYLFIYKIMLDLFYLLHIHKSFGYMGFILDINLYKYILGIISFVIIYIMLPQDNKKPSTIFLQMHFIVMIIPMFTIYAFKNEATLFFLLSIGIFIMECILLRFLPNFKVIRIKNSRFFLYAIITGITIYVYLLMISANGVPAFAALNFSNTYTLRSKVSYPFLTAYLVNWQAKVINPFLITISYLNKNKKWLLISILLQLTLYLMTTHKSYLFIPIAIMLVIELMKKFDAFKAMARISMLTVSSLLVLTKTLNLIYLPSLFIRRFLLEPAQIKFYYYDFFSKNEFNYFSSGAIGKILNIKSSYDIGIEKLIGSIYYNSPNWTNTGYLADAYANMGVFGMLVLSLLLVFIFKIIDSLSIKIGKEFSVGMTLFLILSLNDASLLTTLLTGGLLFLLITLYLYSNIEDKYGTNFMS